MKTTIDITTILSPDLKSRLAVNDFMLYIYNMECDSVAVDFSNVKFATRSFIDEYYNTFMSSRAKVGHVETINIPADIQMIFDAVKNTQHRVKPKQATGTVVKCSTFSDVQKLLSSLAI